MALNNLFQNGFVNSIFIHHIREAVAFGMEADNARENAIFASSLWGLLTRVTKSQSAENTVTGLAENYAKRAVQIDVENLFWEFYNLFLATVYSS